MSPTAAAWDARVSRLLVKAPPRLRAAVLWLRRPDRRRVRISAAVLLVAGSFLSILPVFGLWMLPLGLALLSDDVPALKSPLERAARGIGRAWRWVRDRWARWR
jgi:hypothetical protein